jgi:hypothetical protein
MVDIAVEYHGSLYLLQPLNEQASDWLHEHVADDAQWFVSALVVEPPYVAEKSRARSVTAYGSAVTTDVFGVPLISASAYLYAFAWNLLAELRVGTLVQVYPVPVVRADSIGQLNTRPACAIAVSPRAA